MRQQWTFAMLLVALVCGLALLTRAENSSTDKDLEVRYAEAELRLAEANLKKVERTNERVAKAVSPHVVAEYRKDLEVARFRLESLHAGKDPFPVWLRAAEANWNSSESAWKSAIAANERVPGTLDSLEVERLRWRAEVDRLNVDRGRAVAGKSHEDQLAWQVSLQADEIQRLKEEILRNVPPGTVHWYWR